MEIKTRNVDDVTVVDVFGSLDTQSSGAASDAMARIMKEGGNKMLVNLENLEYVSSAGLRVLLRTAKQLTAAGGILKLCSPAGAVKEVMDISGFRNFLDLHDSESDALSTF
jgi:anti-sigma B factor antagonist